jgi:hypothetical protein
VRIGGSNAGYTMFRGSVKSTVYPLHSPVSPSLPHPVRRVPSRFNWTLLHSCIVNLTQGYRSLFELSANSNCATPPPPRVDLLS